MPRFALQALTTTQNLHVPYQDKLWVQLISSLGPRLARRHLLVDIRQPSAPGKLASACGGRRANATTRVRLWDREERVELQRLHSSRQESHWAWRLLPMVAAMGMSATNWSAVSHRPPGHSAGSGIGGKAAALLHFYAACEEEFCVFADDDLFAHAAPGRGWVEAGMAHLRAHAEALTVSPWPFAGFSVAACRCAGHAARCGCMPDVSPKPGNASRPSSLVHRDQHSERIFLYHAERMRAFLRSSSPTYPPPAVLEDWFNAQSRARGFHHGIADAALGWVLHPPYKTAEQAALFGTGCGRRGALLDAVARGRTPAVSLCGRAFAACGNMAVGPWAVLAEAERGEAEQPRREPRGRQAVAAHGQTDDGNYSTRQRAGR